MSGRLFMRFLQPPGDPELVLREAMAVGKVVWAALHATIEDPAGAIEDELRHVDEDLWVATRRHSGTYFWAFYLEQRGEIRTVIHVSSGARRARYAAFDTAVATALSRRAKYWHGASQ